MKTIQNKIEIVAIFSSESYQTDDTIRLSFRDCHSLPLGTFVGCWKECCKDDSKQCCSTETFDILGSCNTKTPPVSITSMRKENVGVGACAKSDIALGFLSKISSTDMDDVVAAMGASAVFYERITEKWRRGW